MSLHAGETKNGEPRTIPVAGELLATLRMQRDIRDEKWLECPWVFFRGGKRIADFRGSWDSACKAAELTNEKGQATISVELGYVISFAPECRSEW